MSVEQILFPAPSEPRTGKATDSRSAPFSASIDFLGRVQESLHLVCGWIIGEDEAEPEMLWRAGPSHGRGSTIACDWVPRPDLPDFLETGRKARFKKGFFGLFHAPPGLDGLRILIGAKGAARTRITLHGPKAGVFEEFLATAAPEIQFEIAHLLGTVGLARPGEPALSCPDFSEWLDDVPYLEGGGQAHGLSFGFDAKLVGKDGQLFIEGWMKNTGAARAPSLRVVLTETALLSYQVIDQAALRADIAPPGAGGLRRPGFFIVGQSMPVVSATPPSVVIEIAHGGLRHWVRLSPQQVPLSEWRTRFINCASDRARIEPEAHRTLLGFFSRPALPGPDAPAQPRAAPAMAAICLVDFWRDNPCRGLALASLARLASPGLKLIGITDAETARTGMPLGPSRAEGGGGTFYAETLVEGLSKAGLAPHDNVLFLSCSTLIRGNPIAAFTGAAAQRSPQATHWLITPRTVREEHVGALRRILALPERAQEASGEPGASEAFFDFFVPFVAPCRSVLALARNWTPPLPALLYREVIRQAVAASGLGVVRLDSLSSYRQQDESEAQFLRLYRELFP